MSISDTTVCLPRMLVTKSVAPTPVDQIAGQCMSMRRILVNFLDGAETEHVTQAVHSSPQIDRAGAKTVSRDSLPALLASGLGLLSIGPCICQALEQRCTLVRIT